LVRIPSWFKTTAGGYVRVELTYGVVIISIHSDEAVSPAGCSIIVFLDPLVDLPPSNPFFKDRYQVETVVDHWQSTFRFLSQRQAVHRKRHVY